MSYVRLTAFSDTFSPEEIRDYIGIFGAETWKAGDKRGETEILEKENGWSLRSLVDSELEDHISQIMKMTKGHEDKLLNLSERGDCEIQLSCVVYDGSAPALFFEKEVISWIASIGASLDIDLYIT
ncbi:MAG: DUF4279 domain-containing protein [Thalassolituus oleivorans]|uniref:DUF4279 domain-containing protein n=1 Tax=Thalassolituus oleivorans TaxID=187493 RepID=UPI001B46646A|nr:DUF4279 domain-containing protein [Thalassolituus oleivorans]MBQ0728546.1 DUF4279 domain-containing protein [Thalassolituus oleivorans]MBQ0782452.1 DUF4279 domain-containing protein [Thalassolituus oleivorans]